MIEAPSRREYDIVLVRDGYDYDNLLINYPELSDLKVYAIDRRRFIEGARVRNIYITHRLHADMVICMDQGLYYTARAGQARFTPTGKTIIL